MTATQQLPASEVLRLALEKLGPNGEHWIKGAYKRGETYCARGAVFYSVDEASSVTAPCGYLTRAVAASDLLPFENWNDAPERTFPEVKAAFEKAISLAKAAEGGAA
jgi:hypothetical protein